MDVKTCGFLSHTASRFRFGWDEESQDCAMLKQVMLQQIQRLRIMGCRSFYVVPDSGASLWFGELINLLRQQDPELLLQCILPHEEIASKWHPNLRERYFALLEQCTHLTAETRPGDPAATELALNHMLRYCDFVIAVYDPASSRGDPVDRAAEALQQSGKPWLAIHPDTLELEGCPVWG